MKTAPATSLARTETGGYVGAVGGTGLSDEDKRSIRKVLSNASGPLMIGASAARANIPLNTPQAQQSVSDFVSNYLIETKEVELVLDGLSKRTGRGIFRGFAITPHGRSLLEKGLS